MHEECECPEGGSWNAVYNYTNAGNDDHTFTQISVVASSLADMTMQKQGDNPLFATTGIYLTGHTTKKALLDIDTGNTSPKMIDACKTTEIDVATNQTLTVEDQLRAGCSSGNTTLTLKGAGTVDVDGTGNQTTVNAAIGTTVAATLVLDGSVTLRPRTLEVFGGSSSSYGAKFQHNNTNASIEGGTLTGLKMRGYAEFRSYKDTDYTVVNDILVDTLTATTDAHIYLLSNSKSMFATNLYITAGASYGATLTMDTGILNISGTAYIGAAGATQVAKLKIPSAGVDPVLTNVVLKQKGVLELNDSLTVTGTLTIDEVAGEADITFAQATQQLVADVIVFEKGTVDFSPGLSSGSVLATD